jgi:BirA family biotin operon repressor/biotin-[acetyl-CoA-carboxylase] ligase
LVALAARRAILMVRPELESNLKVKWPNDLWLNGKKTAGTLCEGVGSRKGTYIIAGIGINCAEAPLVSGLDAAALAIDPDVLRPRIIQQILEQLSGATPEALSREFAICTQFPSGSSVEWRDRHQPGVILGQGVVLGVGASGELQVMTPRGEMQSLYSEDVSLRSGP